MKKNILFVLRDLRFGGIEKSLIEVLNILDYSKYNVELYLRSNDLALLTYLNKNVRLTVNDTSQKESLYVKQLSFVSDALDKLGLKYYSKKTFEFYKRKYVDSIEKRQKKYFNYEYDVVVCYSQGYTARLVSNIVNAKKRICFFHESTDQYHKINSKSFSYFDSIYTVNSKVTDVLKQCYPNYSHKFRTGFNYLNFEEVKRLSEDVVDLPAAKKTLCTVGRFSQEKGFDIAVNCARIVADRGLDFVWLFIGNGPEFDYVKKLINENDLQERIILLGFQNNPYKYMKMADLYVAPSRMEAYPMTLLESAVLSVPIVSTKTEGGVNFSNNISEIKLCDIDEASLAEAVSDLLTNNDELERMTNEITNIDWNAYKARFIALWDEILD